MHYYTFNVGDYRRDTGHLSPIEHHIYRTLIDWYYLNESPLPSEKRQIMRLNCISDAEAMDNVLSDFFELNQEDKCYHQKRIDEEIAAFRSKSDKARESAKARWANQKDSESNADAMRTHTEGNANHKPITNNHKPLTIEKKGGKPRFAPPAIQEIRDCVSDHGYAVDPEAFFFHYEGNGWMVGKNKMKNWKMALASWNKRESNKPKQQGTGFNRLMELAR
jgi:uncharacterized protein YdaU (DUF1376 family)